MNQSNYEKYAIVKHKERNLQEALRILAYDMYCSAKSSKEKEYYLSELNAIRAEIQKLE